MSRECLPAALRSCLFSLSRTSPCADRFLFRRQNVAARACLIVIAPSCLLAFGQPAADALGAAIAAAARIPMVTSFFIAADDRSRTVRRWQASPRRAPDPADNLRREPRIEQPVWRPPAASDLLDRSRERRF